MSNLSTYTCPSCQHINPLPSTLINFGACAQCGETTRLMEGVPVHNKKGIRQARVSVSPLQPGTAGTWQERPFVLTGRAACWYGAWMVNYWTMLFPDGSILLLEESAGQYAVWEKKPPTGKRADEQMLSLQPGKGDVAIFPGRNYKLINKHRSEKMEVEGTCLTFDDDGAFTLYEFTAGPGHHYRFVSQLNEGLILGYEVHLTSRQALQLTNLRDTPPATHKVECKSCRKDIPLLTYPYTQAVVCPNCHAYWSIKSNSLEQKKGKGKRTEPAIPLHATGTLKNIEYQVTGYCVKADPEGYEWREYTLFSPLEGFAFLSEFNGHWILLYPYPDAPYPRDVNAHSIFAENDEFLLYNRYRPSLVDASGEFPEAVFSCEKKRISEFISPPDIRILEYDNNKSIEWLKGEHIGRSELLDAFAPHISDLPAPIGIGAITPVKFSVNPYLLKVSAAISLFLLWMVYLASSGSMMQKHVYDNTFYLNDTIPPGGQVTSTFLLTKKRSNLEVSISANIRNSWFELAGVLVNKNTGKEYEFEKGVEYYSGFSEGEQWSEGSTSTSLLLNELPAGEYFFRFIPAKDAYNQLNHYTVSVVNDVPVVRNFFIIALFALLPFLIVYLYVYSREKKRWYYSAYSPQT